MPKTTPSTIGNLCILRSQVVRTKRGEEHSGTTDEREGDLERGVHVDRCRDHGSGSPPATEDKVANLSDDQKAQIADMIRQRTGV